MSLFSSKDEGLGTRGGFIVLNANGIANNCVFRRFFIVLNSLNLVKYLQTKRSFLAGVAIQTLIPRKFFEAMRDERGERSLKIWLNKLMISISTSLSTSKEHRARLLGRTFAFYQMKFIVLRLLGFRLWKCAEKAFCRMKMAFLQSA